jgi:phage shock protein A
MNDILQDLQTSHPGEDLLMDRAAEEIRRLRRRVNELLESNNHFERQAREAWRLKHQIGNKYEDLRHLVLIEAAEHVENCGLQQAPTKLIGSELRKKASSW